jgi:tetratricopeptide (TPR) repeat protein
MGLESGNVTPAEEKVSQILRKEFDEEPSRDFQTNLEILREKLSDKSRPIGVLIDNLEPALDANFRFLEKLRGYEDLLRILGDRDICSFTLITSRRSLIVQRMKVHEYSLQGLDIEAWREYFHDCENGATSEALEQMCVDYNGNAKVMDILHGAITNRFDGNIAAYWNRYKDALLADAELETLISVEMDWLRDNQSDAYNLLCRMGCYRYQDVKTVPFEGLIYLLWDVSELRRTWVVDYLTKSSLIEVKGGYYLHPAIRETAKLSLLENRIDWERVNNKAAEFWTESIKTVKTVDDALQAFEGYYHYVEIEEFDSASSIIVMGRDNCWEKMEHLGRSFYRLGMLEKMITSIIKVIKFTKNIYYLGAITNILGDLYWLTGDFQKAIKYHDQSKDLVDICLKPSTFFCYSEQEKFRITNLYISSFTNKGLCRLDLWEIDIAKNFFSEAVKARTEVIEKYNLHLQSQPITSNSCLSLIYAILGKKEKAFHFLAISEETSALYNEHINSWAKGYSLIFRATSYQYLGDFPQALKLFSQAITYAQDSHYTQVKAKALIGIAGIDRKYSRFTDSINKCEESITLLKKIGAKPDLAEAYFQLGLTYQAMGENDQVETYKAKALDLFKQMEAPKQIERVNQAFEQGAKQ